MHDTVTRPLGLDAPVADILTAAADLIAENGHERGYYWPGAPADLWHPGTRLDVTAAIGVACGLRRSGDVEWEIIPAAVTFGDDMPHPAFQALMAHLRVDSIQDVWIWSDRHEVGEIADALRSAVTCVSCGAPYGQPHNPGCAFETVAEAQRGAEVAA